MSTPPWWTARDARIVAAEAQYGWAWQDSQRERPPHLVEEALCCRYCRWWQSDDGRAGACTMPQTDATTNCGATGAEDGCEQWENRLREEGDAL